MSPRTENQYEQIRENRKHQIMHVALELFAEKGYSTTSINAIASRAGISKGLMYNYFSSKEALLREIVHSGMAELMDVFDPNKDNFLTDEEFVFFINESFRIVQDRKYFWKLYFALLAQPAVLNVFDNRLRDTVLPLIRIMTDYFRRKGFTDPESEALLFGALMDGVALNYLYDPEHFPVEKIKKVIIERFG
ncbi:MAG: TetR/AcrR family transcriptional regulator [Bacteroidales bacterium]|nr:TetR/AcrR family transcriptional regulator [Bacteroidales bacterium]